MKPAVMHFTKTSGATTLASAQIALYLAGKLDCPVLDSKEALQGTQEIDTLFVVNSPWAFCDFREEAKAFIIGKRILWVQNDFAIEIPKEFRNFSQIWTTCDEQFKFGGSRHYINWNQLTYTPRPHVGGKGLIYYGAWRESRTPLFKKYFPKLGPTLGISCSSRARGKFAMTAMRARLMDVFPGKVAEVLPHFDATLYLQDTESNTAYHSPANRFYEALAAGLAIFFDKAAISTFDEAGMDISQWAVESPEEILADLANHRAIAEAQRVLLKKDFAANLDIALQQLIGRL